MSAHVERFSVSISRKFSNNSDEMEEEVDVWEFVVEVDENPKNFIFLFAINY